MNGRSGLLRLLVCACAATSLACSIANAGNLIPASVPLTPVVQFPGTTGYIAPDYDARRAMLHSVYIPPIEIFLAPDSPYKGIEPEQMAELTTAFSNALRENVLKTANVVDTPQPDSMILHIALTDVRLTRRSLRLRDLTPIGAAIDGAKRVAGVSKVSLTTLTVQAIGVAPDSDIALFAINNPPPPGSAEPEPVRLDQVPALLEKKAERLRAAFTAIREQH
ncbi:hypothetical protein ABH944_006602 [Caballeronia udeis]|uniref:Lipoprotein n=1 Tax=Caballeronia udeis TaxID=1232866 RepID=A0ABW8MV78_9BURK